ncbi:MAG: hypothetical protein GY835_14030 [bacterium]|nr:hypothetical protein [bacterium]
MAFQLHFPGNDRIRERLERALTSGRLAGAYLFEGVAGAGQEQAAVELAAGIIVGSTELDNPDAKRVRRYSHPDLHYMLPVVKTPPPPGEDEGAAESDIMSPFLEQQGFKAADPYYLPTFSKKPNIPVAAVRRVLQVLSGKPFEGRTKVMIIRDVDILRPDSQDTLLKSLEEPPPGRVIILISYRPEALRPTILSRCQRVPFDALDSAIISDVLQSRGLGRERAELLARLAAGNLEEAIRLAGAEDEKGNSVLAQREEWLETLDICEFGSDIAMLDAVQGVTGGKKRGGLPTQERAEFLALGISWYREVMLQLLEPAEPRVHVDQIDRLARYRNLSVQGCLDRIGRFEKARTQILSNVNAQLTLLTLFFSIRAGESSRRAS